MTEPFAGRTLILAPHMDDEVIGCGGTIASLPDKREVFVAYATDGRSLPGLVSANPGNTGGADLRDIRVAEAKAALSVLGVPVANVFFLDLPVNGLTAQQKKLESAVVALLTRLKPARVLVPFRYDFHEDHAALNAVGRSAATAAGIETMEYFVYWQWKLLAGGDVRNHIRPGQLVKIDASAMAETKRNALNCFKSQTTVYFPGQDRPVLGPDFIERMVRTPEAFLNWPENVPASRIFDIPAFLIRCVYKLEPWLIRRKYFLKAGLRK